MLAKTMGSLAPGQFNKPNPIERVFNSLFGVMVTLGLGRVHHYVLRVRGRKTGKLYSTPVYILTLGDRSFLVGPRGRAQWVRNAEAAGRIELIRGAVQRQFAVKPVTAAEKTEILKAYLEKFRPIVQRYFPVPAGSPASAFAEYTERYPVFELFKVE